jgi:dTDP-4-amino-4,6-dideoxygalactose transaminase
MRAPPFYHQLPVRSPIPFPALLRAAGRSDPGALGALKGLLAREYAASDVVLTGSGTQALQLAILAAAQRTGEASPRLALPAFTCFDVASAGVWNELPLLFFDIDPGTLTPDLESVERTLRAGARILVVAPLYGIPVPWEPLAELAARHGAILIEDAAQGHGAEWRGRRLGTLGEIGVLSFGRGKGWTGGRGGAVLLRGASAARDREAIEGDVAPPNGSVILASAAQWALGRPRIYGVPASLPWLGLGETLYHEPVPPAGMPPRAAVLALASREAAEAEARERRRRAQDLARRLDERWARTPRVADGAEPGFLRLPVRVADARRTVDALSRWGVAPSYPVPLPMLDAVRPRLAEPAGRWPGAETLARELVTLPTHGGVSDRDREHILRGLAAL